MRHLTPRRLFAGLAVAALAGAAVPALAQTVGEVTVIGRYADRDSISQAVSYADLDLTRRADVKALRHRVAFTARDLCRRLGEPSMADSPIVPPCETVAFRDAMKQVRTAVANAGMGPEMAYLEEPWTIDHDGTLDAAPSATVYSGDASATAVTVTQSTVTNGPVPDTPENRARFGGPMSNAGRHTSAAGD